MSAPLFYVELLNDKHVRTGFNSGSQPLDLYFRQHVSQEVRRRVTTCFVAVSDNGCVAGYYTLAAASVLLTDLPGTAEKKLPRYPTVPTVRMGRLAVDFEFKGHGLGGALLADALTRACRAEIAAYTVVVGAKDEIAATFYRLHGFLPLEAGGLKYFLPLATVKLHIWRLQN